MSYQDQRDLIHAGQGFIAALDQSGGSTPKALAAYGVDAAAFSSDAEMFDMIHAMRSRIVHALISDASLCKSTNRAKSS